MTVVPRVPWPVVAVVGCYAGSIEAGTRAMAPLRDLAPAVADFMMPRRTGVELIRALRREPALTNKQNLVRAVQNL